MGNNTVNESYREFQKNQQELASILKGAAETTGILNMSKDTELKELSGKVQNDTFKVMVTGTFKNGKSTFINALLGEEILPAYALPCTAVINEIKYGETKRAILYFRDPLPDPLPEQLAEKAILHMKQHQGKPIPPLEIAYDEIEDYVVIPMGADEKQIKLQSPYEKVELFYPLELLKNGVEIIDSPGLNEDETRTRVTLDYLTKADAILYVLNANAICAGDEMKFVERDLRGNNFESVFFIVNRFDQIREKERPQIRQFAEMKIKEFYPRPELFCLSALNALDGRMDHDEEMVNRSGILPLEKRLSLFLTREKGKAKLASPAKQVRQILSREALENVIPRERGLLETALDDVIARYEAVKPRLELATREKEQKSRELETRIERAGRKFERLAKRQMNEIANSIPAWVDEYTPVHSLGVIPSKTKISAVTGETADHIRRRISEFQQDWQTRELAPEIENEACQIFEAAEKDFSKIYDEIDEINMELAGEGYKKSDVPFWHRVAGAAGGFVLGGVGLAFSAGINGFGKDLAITAAFEFGSMLILELLGFLNPVMIIGVIVAAFIFNINRGASHSLDRLKASIKEEAVKQISMNSEEQARKIADGIEKRFSEVKDQILESVSKELTDIDRQMQAVIEEKRRGEQAVERRRKELAACEKSIYDLNARLDTLIFALAGA